MSTERMWGEIHPYLDKNKPEIPDWTPVRVLDLGLNTRMLLTENDLVHTEGSGRERVLWYAIYSSLEQVVQIVRVGQTDPNTRTTPWAEPPATRWGRQAHLIREAAGVASSAGHRQTAERWKALASVLSRFALDQDEEESLDLVPGIDVVESALSGHYEAAESYLAFHRKVLTDG